MAASAVSDEEARSSAQSDYTTSSGRPTPMVNLKAQLPDLPIKKPAPVARPPAPKKRLHAPYLLEIMLAIGYLVLATFAYLATHWMLLVGAVVVPTARACFGWCGSG